MARDVSVQWWRSANLSFRIQDPPSPFQPLTRCRQLPSLCKSTSLLQTELFPNITLGYHYYDYDVYDFDTHYPMYWPTKPGMVETSLACA